MEFKRILENCLFGIKAKNWFSLYSGKFLVLPRRRRFEILVEVLSRMMFLCVLLMLLGALNLDSTCTHFWVSRYSVVHCAFTRGTYAPAWYVAYDMKAVFFPSSEILPIMRPRRLKSLQRITKEQIYPLFPHSWSWDSHSPLKTKRIWRNILRCYRVPREPILWEL